MDYALGEAAPDGNRYVHFMEAPPALLDTYRLLIRAEATARSIPGPEGVARADAVALLLVQIEDQVTAAGVASATAADAAIRARIAATQVRPPTPKQAHMTDAIESRGVLSVPAGGAVGIADIDRLDRIAADQQGRPYWRAQELGSDHLVGRRFSGLFQPGDSPPDASEFRNHPIFVPGEGGASMLITRPISPRHFIEEGVRAADAFRLQEFRAIDAQAVAEMKSIVGGSHPFVERARRVARGRRVP